MSTAKGRAIAAYAASKVGCAYIYGGYGEKLCTPAFRRERASAYPEQKSNIYTNCPVLSNKQKSCVGCKYEGKQAYDCAQLTRYACKAAGQELVSGANSQWKNTKWADKGPISTLPDVPGVLLYYDNGTGAKTHTGVYQGNGVVVEARNAKRGTIEVPITDYAWTHWAALPGVLSDDLYESTTNSNSNSNFNPNVIMDTITLQKGDKGSAVKNMQELLIKNGYALSKYGADGHFGDETLKAVKDFQAGNGLVVDGLVGKKTLQALQKSTKYSVRIRGLSSSKADEIVAKYGGAKEVDSGAV